MLKGWKYSQRRPNVKVQCDKEFGCVYAVKIKVLSGHLVKIGATREPNVRLTGFASSYATIFCVSPQHLNFFENEEILHNHFAKYRVPAKPGHRVQPELFNISLSYFFKNLPELKYITDIQDADIREDMTYGRFYFAKK